MIFIFEFFIAVLHADVCFWIFEKNLFSSHMQFLEQKVGLGSCNHVFFLTFDQFTCLKLKELFILVLGFLDVVSERLRFNAGSDHLFLVAT